MTAPMNTSTASEAILDELRTPNPQRVGGRSRAMSRFVQS